MKNRDRIKWIALTSLLLLAFQNCIGQNWETSSPSSGSSSLGSNDGSGTGSTPPTTIPPGGVPTCNLSTVNPPSAGPLSGASLTVLSGTGANGGRSNSAQISLQYLSASVGANCNQGATVVFQRRTGGTLRALDDSGNRVAVDMNGINILRAPNGTLAPGQSTNITFGANDNDTTMKCYEGTETFSVFLQSVADASKRSPAQTLTVTFKNNCYPEQIVAESLDAFDQLGSAVAIDGSTAALLASGDDGVTNGNGNTGAVHIYQLSGANTWTRTQILRTEDTSVTSDRGAPEDSPQALALKGDVLVIGSAKNNSNMGAVHVFRRSGATFSQVRKISGSVASGRFGWSVSVDATQLAVGAPGENTDAGAVYLYDLASLNQTARIASPISNRIYFGAAVAVQGTLLAVGAPGSPLYRDTLSGEIFLYQSGSEVTTALRTSSTKSNLTVTNSAGTGTAMLTVGLGSELGAAVAIHNGIVVVGAPGYERSATSRPGLAIVVKADRSLQMLDDPTNTNLSRFGSSVAMGTAGIFIGAPDARTQAGAVDHFKASGANHVFSRRVVSLKGAANDRFGSSVSTSGNFFAVGARINAEPLNNSGSASLLSTVIP
ncbi:MAG: hypothetical protein ACAH59_05620 [Pseudobdellovibrionaceae bacterium]